MSEIPESVNRQERQELDFSSLEYIDQKPPSISTSVTRDQLQAASAAHAQQETFQRETPTERRENAPPAPETPPAVPSNKVEEEAPTTPQDTPRVKDRINRLYGQWKTAEERVQELETELARVRNGQFQQAQLPAQQPAYSQFTQQPVQNGQNYQQFPGFAGEQQDQSAGEYLSRAEFQRMLSEATHLQQENARRQQAQIAARLEAEREFQDVFSNPEGRQAVDQILSQDPYLQQDPRGPVKAALLTRGLLYNPAPTSSAPSTEARKQQISGVGPTDSSGKPPQPDAVAAYQQALERARYTGDLADLARARALQQQALGQA